MTTDSGLVYLSGLLRAGAEPLSPVARAARRRTARVSDDSGEDIAGRAAHAAAGHASESDAPAEVTAAESAEGALAVNSPEAGDRYRFSPDVPPGESTVKSLQNDPSDVAEGVEQHAHAQIQSHAVSPSSRVVRAAPEMNDESHIPDASPTTPVEGEARTRPADDGQSTSLRADEIRRGETERTPAVTEQSPVAAGERELVPAIRSPLDPGRSPATPHGESNDSAVNQSEIVSLVEDSARRTSKAKTAGEVVKKADEGAAAHVGSLLLPGAPSVRGSSASARASRASHEEGAPTFAGDRARVSEGGAEPADASAESADDSAPFTLEAHVEHLRALMQTARAETPDEDEATGAVRPPTVAASHHTPPLTTAARPTPTPAANSGERQPAVLLNQEPPGASSGRVTYATEARPTTPRDAWAQPAGASATRVRGEEMMPAQSAPARTEGAPSVTRDSTLTVATAPARVGPAREGGSTGAAAAGGGRASKLTINRLDVQVVERREPPPAPPATASPPGADPWGALDRELLGRFSY